MGSAGTCVDTVDPRARATKVEKERELMSGVTSRTCQAGKVGRMLRGVANS